jgi:hypothetical protein
LKTLSSPFSGAAYNTKLLCRMYVSELVADRSQMYVLRGTLGSASTQTGEEPNATRNAATTTAATRPLAAPVQARIPALIWEGMQQGARQEWQVDGWATGGGEGVGWGKLRGACQWGCLGGGCFGGGLSRGSQEPPSRDLASDPMHHPQGSKRRMILHMLSMRGGGVT